MRVLHIDPEMLPAAWPHALPWIEKSNSRGGSRYPEEDILQGIVQGKKRMYKLIDGSAFAWIVIGCVENSKNRTCTVYNIAGRGILKTLPKVVEFCEHFAQFNRCQYITCSGRSGWVRELEKYGWNELSRTCGKEILI